MRRIVLLGWLLVACIASGCHGKTSAGAADWTADLGKLVFAMYLLADQGEVVTIGVSSAVVLDSATGKELWRSPKAGMLFEDKGYLDGDRLCLRYYGAHMFSSRTGTELWKREQALPVGLSTNGVWAYEPFQGDQYAGYYGEKVVLLDNASGQPTHVFTPTGILGFSAQPIGASASLAVRTSDAIYLLNSDGTEKRLPQVKCQCQCELAITPAGIICVEYGDNPMPPGSRPPGNSTAPPALVRLIDATTGGERWRAQKAYSWDVNGRPGVLRSNERYVVLIKYPGLVVLDLATGRELYNSPQTAIIMGPQWIALDGENLYWTGFSAQGMETGLERFNPATGQHLRLSSPLGMRLADGAVVGRRLLLLGERTPLLGGGMEAVNYVISMPLKEK
jgi:hypothetical protein